MKIKVGQHWYIRVGNSALVLPAEILDITKNTVELAIQGQRHRYITRLIQLVEQFQIKTYH